MDRTTDSVIGELEERVESTEQRVTELEAKAGLTDDDAPDAGEPAHADEFDSLDDVEDAIVSVMEDDVETVVSSAQMSTGGIRVEIIGAMSSAAAAEIFAETGMVISGAYGNDGVAKVSLWFLDADAMLDAHYGYDE